MFGIDAPETPKGAKFPGQPFGKDAETYLKQLVDGKRVKVELYQVDRYKRLLSGIFLNGMDINLPKQPANTTILPRSGCSRRVSGPRSTSLR
jgi:endonuclease YncB( thermonuclease family)